MKIWARYLLGVIVGVVLGIFLPMEMANAGAIMSFLAELVMNMGRYMVIPLLFFLIPVSLYTLQAEKKLLRVGGSTVLFSLAAAAIGVFIGAVIVLVLSPQRIPIIMAEAAAPETFGISEILLRVFPSNVTMVFWGEPLYLLPPVVLAVLIGLGFRGTHSFSGLMLEFFDTAAGLVYTLTSWVVSVMGVGLVALAAYAVMQFRQIADIALFSEVLFAVLFSAGLVLLVFVPLAVFFFANRQNPLSFLFSILPPVLAAAVSGNHVFTLTTLMRTGRHNQGVSKKAESVVFTLTTLLCRAGTAMVSMIVFIVVLRSYSSLEVSLLQVIGVAFSAILFSVLIGGVPGGNILVFLSLLSSLHSKGVPDAYLILLPLVPVLLRVGVAVDVAVAAGIAQIVGQREKMCKSVPSHDFL